MLSRQEILIALGSNLGSERGDPATTLTSALVDLSRSGLSIRRISRFFATPCFPAGTGPDYVNACIVAESDLNTDQLLELLHIVENEYGRARQQRWGSRTLDLDLLARDSLVLPDAETHDRWMNLPLEAQTRTAPDQLILPHPRIQDRAFVLVPLCDVAADWVHPVLNQTAATLCAALPREERDLIRPL
ncbi:2-amino-4-hydroxy-6-hydroxymethyldihydropteridine diphosphokinase [Thalassococcus lentus]|uniref:2-amino-4-hydroxy-6-hydroxymethyldihydropteridine pyrophosphokinase n=1 Tax=Thalassococcus lentus TaxID=1210524 RepID=A0ABT4XT17_9RHOB|nr:2-amino-4-hydroxy-6-hydroxymethyldihydropteridine diphosphokinase [Thalassococcus lentus]MDA7425108.1 2-amino-4-hydroxy-6-hydroxymethyldihydropteridine diphosphokinase [Thalassococcus lentus]